MSEPTFHAGRFAALMREGKFTDGKLAYASGVSRTMIYYLRKGEREKVSAENLAALAAAPRMQASPNQASMRSGAPLLSTHYAMA